MDIDRAKVRSLGLSVQDVDDALQTYLGTNYVNNFNAFGRYWQVNLQAEGSFRNDVRPLRLIDAAQQPGRDGARCRRWCASATWAGPVMVTRYNLYAAAPVDGRRSFRR